jgi:hypothetical protein
MIDILYQMKQRLMTKCHLFVCGVEFGLFHVFDQFVLPTFIHGYWIEVEMVLTHFTA